MEEIGWDGGVDGGSVVRVGEVGVCGWGSVVSIGVMEEIGGGGGGVVAIGVMEEMGGGGWGL